MNNKRVAGLPLWNILIISGMAIGLLASVSYQLVSASVEEGTSDPNYSEIGSTFTDNTRIAIRL